MPVPESLYPKPQKQSEAMSPAEMEETVEKIKKIIRSMEPAQIKILKSYLK